MPNLLILKNYSNLLAANEPDALTNLIIMPAAVTIDETICQQLLSSNLTPEAVKTALESKGIHSENIGSYLEAIKRMRSAKRRSLGFICMAVGAFLGFLSCVLTIAHALPILFEFIFYGLTMLAVSIVVYGMYCVFE